MGKKHIPSGFLYSRKQLVNPIGSTGATSLSEALKTNSTLKYFNIESENKKYINPLVHEMILC